MLILVATAHAAPTFVSEADPQSAELAAIAWEAAIACTGREAGATQRVVLSNGPVGDGYTGRSHTFFGGRFTVDSSGEGYSFEASRKTFMLEIGEGRPRTIAHEVAHAWVTGGPPGLVEGATDLLADCIAEQAPERFPKRGERPVALKNLEDLRTWQNQSCLRDACGPGYFVSAALMREAAKIVPRTSLWRLDWTWDAFHQLLDEAGGQVLWAVVEGGLATQRAAFEDLDGDGLTRLQELALGTDPLRADSDGDGFFDGVTLDLAMDAIPLPTDSSPVCLGLAAGPEGATVQAEAAQPAGTWRPTRAWIDLERQDSAGKVKVAPGGSLQVGGKGVLARVTGEGLVADHRCRSGPMSTVYEAADLASFAALAEEVEGLAARAREAWGVKRRIVLQVGASHAEAMPIPGAMWQKWAAGESPSYALAITVAWFYASRTYWTPPPGMVEALARTLVAAPEGDYPWWAMEEADVAKWTAAGAVCGWPAVLEGRCPNGPEAGLLKAGGG